MRLNRIIALTLSLSLAAFTGSALAKSDKNKNSLKSSVKTLKLAKSEKGGKGLGHCKSLKNSLKHSSKRGKGHDRDGCEVPSTDPVCVVDVPDPTFSSIFLPNPADEFTFSITYSGHVCDNSAETVSFYSEDIEVDGGSRICTLVDGGVGDYTLSLNGNNYSYPVTSYFECEFIDQNV